MKDSLHFNVSSLTNTEKDIFPKKYLEKYLQKIQKFPKNIIESTAHFEVQYASDSCDLLVPVGDQDPSFVLEQSLGPDDVFKNVTSYVSINS